MTETTYKPGIETPPLRMLGLPISRGYPVPWFVAWENGEPEFRAADGKKFRQAIREKLCWVCGGQLGRYMTFVLGPMCGATRTTAEPPCHRECAQYSARNCPFLSKPQMVRRENDMPAETVPAAGMPIKRNPGVTLLWTTRKYELFGDGSGGVLIKVGDPESMEWYCEGREATRAEVQHSVETGLPILAKVAAEQDAAENAGAMDELLRRKAWLEGRYPAA